MKAALARSSSSAALKTSSFAPLLAALWAWTGEKLSELVSKTHLACLSSVPDLYLPVDLFDARSGSSKGHQGSALQIRKGAAPRGKQKKECEGHNLALLLSPGVCR